MLYPCDPNKNKTCTKSGCFINAGPCSNTTNFNYRDMLKFDVLNDFNKKSRI